MRLRHFGFEHWSLVHLDLFRISIFGFQISYRTPRRLEAKLRQKNALQIAVQLCYTMLIPRFDRLRFCPSQHDSVKICAKEEKPKAGNR